MARKRKDSIDLGIGSLDLGLGGMYSKPFRIDLGMGQENINLRDGITGMRNDISGLVRDSRTGYQAAKKTYNTARQRAVPAVRGAQLRGKGFISKLRKPKNFTIYTQRDGVIRPHNFATYRQAMEFRQRAVASGAYDNVSQVPEQNPNI